MMGVMKEEIIAMSLCLYNLAGMVVFVPSLDRLSLEWEERSASCNSAEEVCNRIRGRASTMHLGHLNLWKSGEDIYVGYEKMWR